MPSAKQSHFIKGVIVRVDFSVPIPAIDNSLSAKVTKKAIEIFPIKEPRPIIGQEFQFTPPKTIEEKRIEKTEWFFHGQDREKTLCITDRCMFIECKTYAGYDSLKSDFIAILDAIYAEYSEVQVSRTGLRYANHLEFPTESDPLEWSRYIKPELLSSINFIPEDKGMLSRMFNDLEFNYSDAKVKFQYGLYNQDYPARIKQKLFILDYDVFIGSVQERSEVISNIDIFHAYILRFFESSITADLKGIING